MSTLVTSPVDVWLEVSGWPGKPGLVGLRVEANRPMHLGPMIRVESWRVEADDPAVLAKVRILTSED